MYQAPDTRDIMKLPCNLPFLQPELVHKKSIHAKALPVKWRKVAWYGICQVVIKFKDPNSNFATFLLRYFGHRTKYLCIQEVILQVSSIDA